MKTTSLRQKNLRERKLIKQQIQAAKILKKAFNGELTLDEIHQTCLANYLWLDQNKGEIL